MTRLETPLGAHISTAGGVAKAPARATEIGATAMQIFTKSANQWKEKEILPAEAALFREGLAKTAVYATLALTAFRFAATGDSSSSSQQTADFTATLMQARA